MLRASAFFLFALCEIFVIAPAAAQLQAPLDCTQEAACFIQNYPDVDAGPGAQDPFCGSRTYDGHDGLDIRIRMAAARAGVHVLSPAAGKVVAVRDGEVDGKARTSGRDAVADRECGNGVLIATSDNVEVQLCHMRENSITVKPGADVSAGERLGLVGQSGMAQFPHLHISVRRSGAPIDPGSGKPLASGGCTKDGGKSGATLWSQAARQSLPFQTSPSIADWGFVEKAPEKPSDVDLAPSASAAGNGDALIFYAAFGAPAQGDLLRLRLIAPDGSVLGEQDFVQPKDQAQMMRYVGKRTPTGGWRAGPYRGEAAIVRGGRIIASRSEVLRVVPSSQPR
jgi:hypothetical protein